MPAVNAGGAPFNARGKGAPTFEPFPITETQQNYTISGVTRDSTGAALGSVTVYLFALIVDTPVLAATVVSDASGNYKFYVAPAQAYWIATYKAGSPDLAGATVNTLVGI